VFAAKEFVVTDAISFNLGATYRGRSGTPVSELGAHPLYGNGEAFLTQRGTAGRLPWRNDVDGRLGLNYKLSENNLVTLGVDVFNLFNFQTVTSVDQNYTFESVTPCESGTALQCMEDQGYTADDVNTNFNKPTGYQAARSIRFGAKVTF
jgi:hypothetical protein